MTARENQDRNRAVESGVETPRARPGVPYRAPEVHRLGDLNRVQATSYGNTYDGVYTNRSWWYTSG